MYHFITKKEYFSALDIPEIDSATKNNQHWGLKHLQDCCVLHKILPMNPGNVAEIGGGQSRTLPFLQQRGWKCWNIEPFQGVGNGPRKYCHQAGVENINAYLGTFSPLLDNMQFDLVYSVSVVEHVPDDDLCGFFREMWKILNPGGQAWHAIDFFLRDEDTPYAAKRLIAIFLEAMCAGFRLIQPEPIPDARFICTYASNPDLTISQWRRVDPNIENVGRVCQCVSLMMGLSKPAK